MESDPCQAAEAILSAPAARYRTVLGSTRLSDPATITAVNAPPATAPAVKIPAASNRLSEEARSPDAL